MTAPNARSQVEIVAGARFHYKKSSGVHSIWAKGPLLSEMIISVRKKQHNKRDVKKICNVNRNSLNSDNRQLRNLGYRN